MTSNYRVCRCGCNQRVPIRIMFPSGRTMERMIKCSCCGQSVDQNTTNYKVGKWYQDGCMSDFKNFYMALTKPGMELNKPKSVLAIRDMILTEMIMRHDVRMFHKHWNIIVKGNAVPIMMKPQDWQYVIA